MLQSLSGTHDMCSVASMNQVAGGFCTCELSILEADYVVLKVCITKHVSTIDNSAAIESIG